MPLTDAVYRKYGRIAWLYDVLNYPWEWRYKHWRPQIVAGVTGKVLEIGVGTGKNLPCYSAEAQVTGIDLSPAMLSRARRTLRQATCQVTLLQQDATQMIDVVSASMDWVVSTFAFCVMPDAVQTLALAELQRVLKPGGKFRLVEMVYSQSVALRRRQVRTAPLIEWLYGARFDRQTLEHINAAPQLRVTRTQFMQGDTYLLIEGERLGG